eukprot:14382572-Ditylum_brightwellii.AAC.1
MQSVKPFKQTLPHSNMCQEKLTYQIYSPRKTRTSSTSFNCVITSYPPRSYTMQGVTAIQLSYL